MGRVLNVGPHFFLWGHEHKSCVRRFDEDKNFPMVLASGTSTSSRTRSEANSFNYLTFSDTEIVIEIFRHSEKSGTFEVISETRIPQVEERKGLAASPVK